MSTNRFDWGILFSLIALTSIGLLTLLSIASNLFYTQLLFIIIGLLFFLFFAFLDFQIFFSLYKFLYPFFIVCLLLTFIFGENIRGAVRWINLGPFSLQFSEILKPFFVLFFAFFLGMERHKWKKISLGIFLAFPVLILIFKQPDLGNTIVYLSILAGLFMSSGYGIIITLTGGFLAISMPFLWNLLHDYQKNRIFSFLNPGLDPQGTGYNALQAMIAVGSGGLLGKGLGRGTQSHLNFLPEHHTDFIFASFAEEFGFIGVIILIILYSYLLFRILSIAKNSTSSVAVYISVGIFSLLFSQIFINIGMNIGLVPITGITLPLLSYGGSSIISTMISLGIIESLVKTAKKQDIMQIK